MEADEKAPEDAEKALSTRHTGGGSVMVWICMSTRAPYRPVKLTVKIYFEEHVALVDKKLKRAGKVLVKGKWIFN